MRVLLAMGDRAGALALEPQVRSMWAHFQGMGMVSVALSLQGLLVWCAIVKSDWRGAAAEMAGMLPLALRNPRSVTSSFALLGTVRTLRLCSVLLFPRPFFVPSFFPFCLLRADALNFPVFFPSFVSFNWNFPSPFAQLHAMLNICESGTPIVGRVIVDDVAEGLRSLEEASRGW